MIYLKLIVDSPSWEPAESFIESEEMIDEFWGHVGKAPRPKASQYSFLEEIVPDDYVGESWLSPVLLSDKPPLRTG